jgi:hypothetical protein
LFNPQTRELKIKNIDAMVMHAVLQFIYTGKAEISDRVIVRVLEAADFLSIPGLLPYSLTKINADVAESGLSFY